MTIETTKIIPVIHYHDDEQVMRNATIASEAGCNGVLLIEMSGNNAPLRPAALAVKEAFPELKVGINYLGVDPRYALESTLSAGLDMTWTDAQPTHSDNRHLVVAKDLAELLHEVHHEMFVGVAFKHQRYEPDPVAATRRAIATGLIPTTSGPTTGVAADVAHVSQIREQIEKDAPLAIASGITPENFASFKPFLSHVLVATGVSKNFYELDEHRLAALMAVSQ